MQITIGVVGPTESIDQILKVTNEFPGIQWIPFVYEHVTELPTLIEQGKFLVDQWLFSGVMNYTYALQHKLVTEAQANFPALHGSSFFGKLLEVQQKEQAIFHSFSVDHITDTEIQKVLSFYDMHQLHFKTIPSSTKNTFDEIAQAHQGLFERGETEAALTTIKAVYNFLKTQGVPVYRLTPSYLSIKLAIELLIEKAQVRHFESLQMAVIACQVLNADKSIESSLFEWKYQDLKIKKSLLNLSEQSNGSFIEVADGLYYIYTTKGEIDEKIETMILTNIASFKLNEQLAIGFSIGYGQTVLAAEQHARHGLNQIKTGGHPSLLIVHSKENITQKIQSDDHNVVNTEALKHVLKENYQLDKTNIQDTLRLVFYVRKYHQQHFTADDVAHWFNNTKRNARRILTELQQNGVIEIFDKIQATPRGRPSHLYRFTNEHLFRKKEP